MLPLAPASPRRRGGGHQQENRSRKHLCSLANATVCFLVVGLCRMVAPQQVGLAQSRAFRSQPLYQVMLSDPCQEDQLPKRWKHSSDCTGCRLSQSLAPSRVPSKPETPEKYPTPLGTISKDHTHAGDKKTRIFIERHVYRPERVERIFRGRRCSSQR